jgi:hypothetical protein
LLLARAPTVNFNLSVRLLVGHVERRAQTSWSKDRREHIWPLPEVDGHRREWRGRPLVDETKTTAHHAHDRRIGVRDERVEPRGIGARGQQRDELDDGAACPLCAHLPSPVLDLATVGRIDEHTPMPRQREPVIVACVVLTCVDVRVLATFAARVEIRHALEDGVDEREKVGGCVVLGRLRRVVHRES